MTHGNKSLASGVCGVKVGAPLEVPLEVHPRGLEAPPHREHREHEPREPKARRSEEFLSEPKARSLSGAEVTLAMNN